MAESQAKIRLTLDGQQAIREADRLKGKTKEAADAAGKLGQNWREGGATIAKMVVGVTAIVAGLRAAASAAADLRREQGDAYNKQEETLRSLATAERRAGLRPGMARTAQTRTPGQLAFTTEQATEVIDAAREAKVTSPAAIERAMLAYGSGYFSKDELFDKRRRTAISQESIDARYNVADVGSAREARIRRQESAFTSEQFAEQGGGPATVNQRMEADRTSGPLGAAYAAVVPDFVRRDDTERALRREARSAELESKGLALTALGRLIDRLFTKPQTGTRGEGSP
jgi:hypothetical protein